MKISRNEIDMMSSLLPLIEHKWGISVGYICALGAAVQDNAEYVIINDDTNELLHILDVDITRKDIAIGFKVREWRFHENKVEAFLTRIKAALVDGELYFNPGITRKFALYDINVSTLPNGKYSIDVSAKHFRKGYHALYEDIKADAFRSDPTKKPMWNEMSAEERAYILSDRTMSKDVLLVVEELKKL